MWEQLQLTYDYGVDKLWILNVGDLKPMEYPITLFLDMAWNPKLIILILITIFINYTAALYIYKYKKQKGKNDL